jgi:hypothetical protein
MIVLFFILLIFSAYNVARLAIYKSYKKLELGTVVGKYQKFSSDATNKVTYLITVKIDISTTNEYGRIVTETKTTVLEVPKSYYDKVEIGDVNLFPF